MFIEESTGASSTRHHMMEKEAKIPWVEIFAARVGGGTYQPIKYLCVDKVTTVRQLLVNKVVNADCRHLEIS